MRPVRLQIEGFGAFRERVDVDFSDVDYLALVGPTGSGKSTVIDAMCFALYGSVPRYGDMRRVGYAVTTGSTEARVSFTFDAGGARYVATRVVRVKPDGKAVTREARLEVHAGASATPVAGTAGELDEAVVRLLGMPFEHFTRCVVLPQGEFARFLTDPPRKRQDMLVRLLGLDVYGRMGKRAGELRSYHEGRAAQLRAQVQALAFATPEAADRTAARAGELGTLQRRLAAARAGVGELERRAREADEEATRAAGLAARLEAVRVPDGVAAATGRLAAAATAVSAARQELSLRTQEYSAAEEARRGSGDRRPIDTALFEHRQLADLEREAQAASSRLLEARTAAGAARDRAEAAAAALSSAQEALAATQAARAAHLLAERLVPGQPCPVCRSVVTAAPEHPPAPDVIAARQEVEQARRVNEETARVATTATGREEAQAELHRQRQGEAAALRTRLAEGPAERELRVRLAAIEEADRILAAARAAEGEARRRERDAVAGHEQALAAVDRLRAAFERTRDALASLGAPPAARRDLTEDWAALAAWAEGEGSAQRKVEAEAAAEALRLRGQAREQLAEAASACASAGLDTGSTDSLEPLEQACVRAEAAAHRDLERIREAMVEAATLTAEATGAADEAALARELARHLSARGFERWILTETMEGLVAGASGILRDLSHAAYSLATDDDGEFWVIDHANADERRSAKTLSGGETFQASLALALALADQLSSLAAAGAAPIEATFIDEGFGTLDADTLETVAATLEQLVGDHRMVGVVTHVRELAERVPVRLEVAKGPRTATVTKADAYASASDGGWGPRPHRDEPPGEAP